MVRHSQTSLGFVQFGPGNHPDHLTELTKQACLEQIDPRQPPMNSDEQRGVGTAGHGGEL